MIRLWAARVGDGNSGGFVQIFDELIDGALEHLDHTGLRAANGEGGGRARLGLSHRLTGRSVVTIPPMLRALVLLIFDFSILHVAVFTNASQKCVVLP
jgi:hypothetical protein